MRADSPSGIQLLMRRTGMFDVFRHIGYSMRGRGERAVAEDLERLMEEVNRLIAQRDPRGASPGSVLISAARSIAHYCNDDSRWPSCPSRGEVPWWVQEADEETLLEWRSRGGVARQALRSAVTQRLAALAAALKARRLRAELHYRIIVDLINEGWTWRRIRQEHGWSFGKISRAARWGVPQDGQDQHPPGATPDIELSDESVPQSSSYVRRHPRHIGTARSARAAVLRAFGLSDMSAPRASAAPQG